MVLRDNPSLAMTVYVDDRAVCARSQSLSDVLRRALQATIAVDQALGFQLHPDKVTDKCEFFGRGVASVFWQAFLTPSSLVHRGDFQTFRGPLQFVETQIFRGGGQNSCYSSSALVANQDSVGPLTYKDQSSSHVGVVAFSWAGARRGVPCFELLHDWRVAIERALMTTVKSRSRFLLWPGFLGPDVDPLFSLQMEVLRHQQWKVSSRGMALHAYV